MISCTPSYSQHSNVYKDLIEFYHNINLERKNCFLFINSDPLDPLKVCNSPEGKIVCELIKNFNLKEIRISKDSILLFDSTVRFISDPSFGIIDSISFSKEEIEYSRKLDSISSEYSKRPESKSNSNLLIMAGNSLKNKSVEKKRDISQKKEVAIISIFGCESFKIIAYRLFTSRFPEPTPLEFELLLN